MCSDRVVSPSVAGIFGLGLFRDFFLLFSVSVDEFSDGFVAFCEVDGVLCCFNVFLFRIMDIYLWTKGICVFLFL